MQGATRGAPLSCPSEAMMTLGRHRVAMTAEVSTVDPEAVEPARPASGLVERTPFRVGARRMVMIRVRGESAQHYRGGPLYGWVRAGRGRIVYGERSVDVTRGDFLYVPADTVHGYDAAAGGLEVLAVVDGGVGVTQVCAPGARGTLGAVGNASSGTTRPDGDDGVQVVGPDELVPTVESPDLVRETPFPDADVLLMRVRAEGGAAAGWHHHGENVYFGYAVDGPSETEYGLSGERVARIEVGECFHVPPGLVHRDTNPTDETHTGVIWLCGGEPWVVNVGGPA